MKLLNKLGSLELCLKWAFHSSLPLEAPWHGFHHHGCYWEGDQLEKHRETWARPLRPTVQGKAAVCHPPPAPPGAPCVRETQLRSLVMAGPKTDSWWFRGLLGCRRDGEEKEGGCLGGRDWSWGVQGAPQTHHSQAVSLEAEASVSSLRKWG